MGVYRGANGEVNTATGFQGLLKAICRRDLNARRVETEV